MSIYNNIYAGGCVINQWGTFKRNKRDIITTIQYNGEPYELIDNLQGFYNKALVYKNLWTLGHLILVSYNTVVAEVVGNNYIIHGYYSPTTARHINAFLKNLNIETLGKKDIEKITDKWQEI